jgi:LEA14-like dessication related protein
MKNYLGFGILALAVIYILRKKSLANNAKFSLENVAFNWNKREVYVRMGILNPTNAQITISSILGSLFLNNNEVATVETFSRLLVSPNAKTSLNLTMKPTLYGIFTSLKSIFSKKDSKEVFKNYKVKFVGTANANGVNLPLEFYLG